MKFNDAFELLRRGKRVRRKCWENGYYIYINALNHFSTATGDTAYISCKDVLATDWLLFRKAKPGLYDWAKIIRDKQLCWFWDTDEKNACLGQLSDLDPKNEFPFGVCGGRRYSFCRPAKIEEVKFYKER